MFYRRNRWVEDSTIGTECEGCAQAYACPFAGCKNKTRGALKDMPMAECAELIRKTRIQDLTEETEAKSY